MLIIPLLSGLLSASLVNYLADVLPRTRKFSHPVCGECDAQQDWWHYLLLKRCPRCGTARSKRTWIVLIVIAGASLLLWIFPRPSIPIYPLAMLLLTFCSLVAVIDLEHRVVLHPVSIFGAILGLVLGTLMWELARALLGGAVGFGIMLAFYLLGTVYVRRMAKKKGLDPNEAALGFGDVNLAGILGLVLGWPLIIPALFIAILAGGLVSLFIVVGMLITKQYQPFTAIPYAPFLLLAALFLLFR